MNVAILHCHFRRGGVTQVVENHVAALSELIPGKVVLVSGGRNDGLSARTLRLTEQLTVDGLDYDSITGNNFPSTASSESLTDLARHIASSIANGLRAAGLEPDDTVLHWHNHSLGKNVAAPEVIRCLGEHHGFRQLLQIHDFAEDFRPENLVRLACTASPRGISFEQYCYPVGRRISYATLTTGDAQVLSGLGIAPGQIDVLPNSVSLGENVLPDPRESLAKITRAAGLPERSRWCLYPVRGIRRKNVGEFLLVSRLLPESTSAGITLPPATPIENRSYRRWQEIGRMVAPKAVFDAGTFESVSFLENLAASDFVLSTSVAEGFGMAFLEPWLAGRGVIARRIPNVVDDFTANGIRLDRFYDSIRIPASSSWIEQCQRETLSAFEAGWQMPESSAGRPLIKMSMNADVDDGLVDFAALTTNRQTEVLVRMARDPGFENDVKSRNAGLVEWLANEFDRRTLDENAERIGSKYSLENAGRQLVSLYAKLGSSDPDTETNPSELGIAVSSVTLVCGQRDYSPCRTETEIHVPKIDRDGNLGSGPNGEFCFQGNTPT